LAVAADLPRAMKLIDLIDTVTQGVDTLALVDTKRPDLQLRKATLKLGKVTTVEADV
jgi:hypothetical protein